MAKTLLVIDDDAKLCRLLERYLGDFGYAVHACTRPREGLRLIRSLSPDLVILDVMLPEMNGFEVCRKIRRDSALPVIMLTARGEVTDRVAGLELGADDYLAKPFEPRELVARIQTVLRRSGRSGTDRRQRFGRLTIDFSSRRVWRDGAPVGLTTAEYGALAVLARDAGRVMDRDEILQALRGMDCEAFNRSVDITMSRLRQKLGDDPRNPEFVKTVWGVGYVLIAGGGPDGPETV